MPRDGQRLSGQRATMQLIRGVTDNTLYLDVAKVHTQTKGHIGISFMQYSERCTKFITPKRI